MFFRYSCISGASFKRFKIWVILALVTPSFLANSAWLLTRPWLNNAEYRSTLRKWSLMEGLLFLICFIIEELYGILSLPGVRVTTASLSQIKTKGYRHQLCNPFSFSNLFLTWFWN
jgi:hypothetical protein